MDTLKLLFQHLNLEYLLIKSQYSTADYILNSGNTSVICETKERRSIIDYYTELCEVDKLIRLAGLRFLLDAPVIYVVHYSREDLYLVWDLEKNIEYSWLNDCSNFDVQECRISNSRQETRPKEVYYKNFLEFDFAYSGDFLRIDIKEVQDIINHRLEQEQHESLQLMNEILNNETNNSNK